MLKQRLLGVALILIGIIVPAVAGGDATASVILIPLGLGATLAKENYM